MLSGQQLEMVRIDDGHWLIHDPRRSSSDARHVVACVTQSEEGFDVLWLDPAVPLPMRYRARSDILEDIHRWYARRSASTRPIEIPSLPPFAALRRRRAE